MHIRPQDRSIDITPGPPDYSISRDLGGQKSTFHVRPQEGTSYVTPGPGTYSPTNRELGEAPKYTMKGRHEIAEHPVAAPYRDIPSTVGEGPKISLASRHEPRGLEDSPGPNYIPPPLGSDAQKTAMSYRHGEVRDSRLDNPGPGAYNIEPRFANDAPKATLHGRTEVGGVDSCSPGPAAYGPPYYNWDAHGGAYMGIRPKDRDPDQSGPYVNLPSTLEGPAWTIGQREGLDIIPV
jgi:hypothetical protein